MTKNLDKKSLGYRLAKIQFELGIYQKEFAIKLGVT